MGNKNNKRRPKAREQKKTTKKKSTRQTDATPQPASPVKKKPRPKPARKGAKQSTADELLATDFDKEIEDMELIQAAQALAKMRDTAGGTRRAGTRAPKVPETIGVESDSDDIESIVALAEEGKLAEEEVGEDEEEEGGSSDDDDEEEEEEAEEQPVPQTRGETSGSRKAAEKVGKRAFDELIDKRYGLCADEPLHEHEPFDIPFQVPCGGTLKELTLPSTTSWNSALVAFGEKMVREPANLKLGYLFSWQLKGKKQAPLSLENKDEWKSMKRHVLAFREAEGMKNKGRGPTNGIVFYVRLEIINDGGLQDKAKKGKASKALIEDSDDDEAAPKKSKDPMTNIAGEICKFWHCEKCGRACKPRKGKGHCVFNMKMISVWSKRVELGLASIDQIPKDLLPDGDDDDDEPAAPPPPRPPPPAQQVQPPPQTPATMSHPSATPVPHNSAHEFHTQTMAPHTTFPAHLYGSAIGPYAAAAGTMPGVPHIPPMYHPYAYHSPAPVPFPGYPTPYPMHHPFPSTPQRTRRSSEFYSPAESTSPGQTRRPTRKRRLSVSDDDEYAGERDIEYPLIGDWLADIDADIRRGRDQQNYVGLMQRFYHQGLHRLDDLTRDFMNVDRLSEMVDVPPGTASRLLDWAKEDKRRLQRDGRLRRR